MKSQFAKSKVKWNSDALYSLLFNVHFIFKTRKTFSVSPGNPPSWRTWRTNLSVPTSRDLHNQSDSDASRRRALSASGLGDYCFAPKPGSHRDEVKEADVFIARVSCGEMNFIGVQFQISSSLRVLWTEMINKEWKWIISNLTPSIHHLLIIICPVFANVACAQVWAKGGARRTRGYIPTFRGTWESREGRVQAFAPNYIFLWLAGLEPLPAR